MTHRFTFSTSAISGSSRDFLSFPFGGSVVVSGTESVDCSLSATMYGEGLYKSLSIVYRECVHTVWAEDSLLLEHDRLFFRSLVSTKTEKLDISSNFIF